jgi:hypothetical protein
MYRITSPLADAGAVTVNSIVAPINLITALSIAALTKYVEFVKVVGDAGVVPSCNAVVVDPSNATDASLLYFHPLYLTKIPPEAIVCPVPLKTTNLKSGPKALI